MDIPSGLSVEQQFRLQTLKQQVETLSKEQAQTYLLEVLRQMMVKDNLVKHLLKNSGTV
ncbi:MAG: NblA/ycf18 family protein [Cyanobacteria bacterium P01_A01_bin.84]